MHCLGLFPSNSIHTIPFKSMTQSANQSFPINIIFPLAMPALAEWQVDQCWSKRDAERSFKGKKRSKGGVQKRLNKFGWVDESKARKDETAKPKPVPMDLAATSSFSTKNSSPATAASSETTSSSPATAASSETTSSSPAAAASSSTTSSFSAPAASASAMKSINGFQMPKELFDDIMAATSNLL